LIFIYVYNLIHQDLYLINLLISQTFRLSEKLLTSTQKRISTNNSSYMALVGATISGVLLLSVAGTFSHSMAQFQEQDVEQQQLLLQTNSTAQNGTRIVQAGGGGPVAPVTWFIPQNVSINVGQTVTWTNPTPVPEPHTITFIRDPRYFAPLDSAYLIANGTELRPAVPGEINTEPQIIPSQNGTTTDSIIIAANNRARSPVAVDSQNNATYLQPNRNVNYTMTGDELFVNSGALWPEGQIPPGAPPITSFSIKFEKAGTYDYLCLLHPWMTGRVIVQ
jgi:plastocyanin